MIVLQNNLLHGMTKQNMSINFIEIIYFIFSENFIFKIKKQFHFSSIWDMLH